MSNDHQRPRASRLQWVRIGDMRISPKAQREFRKPHAEMIASDFDLEALGFPVVSLRDGYYWLLDGQHRVAALKLNGFTDDDLIQCECYEGLTEAGEAELFLRRAASKRIGNFDEFRIALVAGRETECDIERVVTTQGRKISRSRSEGSIMAVDALRFGYRLGPVTLGRAIRILGDAYDDDPNAFKAELLKGMALVCQRYDGALDDEKAVDRLSGLSGGVISLTRKANALKLKTGHSRQHCVAAAIVDTLNGGRGGQKLESWWR